MNPRLRSAMQIWVSGVFIALMVLRAGAEKQSNEPEFSSTVQEVLKALRANDKKVFSGFISKNGIELTYVEKNWGLSGRVLPKPKQTHKDPFFNRGKIPPTVWTIYNVKIPKEELIKDKLAKEDFNQACQKFGSLELIPKPYLGI